MRQKRNSDHQSWIITLLAALLVLIGSAAAQSTPDPLRVTRITGITDGTAIDNRSAEIRQNDYHTFCATGSGTWSAQLQYSDTSSSGPWTNFTGAAVDQDSASCSSAAVGYHAWLRFSVTGTVNITYAGVKQFYGVPGSAASDVTGSNVGAGAYGWFYQKSGTDLEFYSMDVTSPITAALGSSIITLACPTCVTTGGSYANPSWITGLDWSKLSGSQPAPASHASSHESGGGDELTISASQIPATVVYNDQANSFDAGAKQTMQASATTAGGNIACAALPSSPAAGDIACDSADGNKLKSYSGSTWFDLTGAGLANAFSSITDGSNTANSSGSDTFKIRAGSSKLSVTVGDDDVTHGDNVVLDVAEANIVHQNISGAGSNDHAAIDTHISATSAHGATGNLVGTTGTQTLTNKTLVDASTSIVDQADVTKQLVFQVSAISTGTARTLTVPDANTVLVQSSSAGANQFANGINSSGVIQYAQPAFSDISGTATKSQTPATTVHTDQANSYTGGTKQTFQADATTAGSNIACAALPSGPAVGDLACDSGDGNKIKQYSGSVWVDLTGGGVSDAYTSMTDGSTTATASGTDTFKFRAGSSKLTVAVTDDDVTHGDNVVYDVAESNIVHQNISGVGTNDHAAIDTHIAAGGDVHGVTGDFVADGQANTYDAGMKQTLQASATTAGGNVACAALPSSPAVGDIACDSSDSNKLKSYNGSVWEVLSGGDIAQVGTCTSGDCGIEGGTDIFPFLYEGTADGFETTFSVTDPTADNAIVFPDASGTVLLSGGALGTPSSGTLTNATGLPISTGVSGLAANVATFLGAPSIANLASALTDEDYTPGSESGAEAVLDLQDLQGTLTNAQGGTGADTSSSTGVATVSSGAWSIVTTITGLTAISFGTDPGDSGAIRLENNTGIYAELATPGTDGYLIFNASDVWESNVAIHAPAFVSTDPNAGKLTMDEADANGANYLRFTVQDAITSNLTLKFPNADPAGSIMTWATPSSNISAGTWYPFSATSSGQSMLALTEADGDLNAGFIGQDQNYTWTGTQDFSSATVSVATTAYGVGWNGSAVPASQDAVYDKIETIGSGSSYDPFDTASETQVETFACEGGCLNWQTETDGTVSWDSLGPSGIHYIKVTSDNDGTYALKSNNRDYGNFDLDEGDWHLQIKFNPYTALTGSNYYLGWLEYDLSVSANPVAPVQGIYLRYVDGTDTNYQYVLEVGDSSTVVDSGLAAAAQADLVLDIERSGGTITFTLNGSYAKTICSSGCDALDTNIPTDDDNAIVLLLENASGTGTKGLMVDKVAFEYAY